MPVNQLSEINRVEEKLTAVMTARPRDPAACIAALEEAVALTRSGPDAAEAFHLPELLDLLAEEYEHAGRVDDALEAMRQAIDAGWDGHPDGRCRLAEILMRAGRVTEAEPIWAQVKADTPGDVWLFKNAGLEYAAIGDHETALEWLTEGLRLAVDTGDPQRLVAQLLDLRQESLTALGRDPDELQARGQEFLATATGKPSRAPALASPTGPNLSAPNLLEPATPTGQGGRTLLAWAWFPASEYEQALRRWPDLAEPGGPAQGGRDHRDYCRAMQAKLRDAADAGTTGIRIAPILVEEFLAWCAQHGEDPAGARAAYCADLARTRPDRLIAWPPGRNQPCWCGSGRKYKKCCAAPESRQP